MDRFGRSLLWTVWALCALTAIGMFFVPAFIIRPFTHQSARGLLTAMAIRDRAPLGTLIAGSLAVIFALMLWGAVSKGRKIALGVVMALVTFSAVMARLNYFEWMFHPVRDAQFEAESESKLGSEEMILTVRFGNDARAYPIREMAYHHILNDVVAGVPVAVTY